VRVNLMTSDKLQMTNQIQMIKCSINSKIKNLKLKNSIGIWYSWPSGRRVDFDISVSRRLP
jgi:hypothetical protein